jgi:hypothetical protein
MGPFILISLLLQIGEIIERDVPDENPLDLHEALPLANFAPVWELGVQVRLINELGQANELIGLQRGEDEVDGALGEGLAEFLVVVKRACPYAILDRFVDVVAVLASDNEELAVLEMRKLDFLVEVSERRE